MNVSGHKTQSRAGSSDSDAGTALLKATQNLDGLIGSYASVTPAQRSSAH